MKRLQMLIIAMLFGVAGIASADDATASNAGKNFFEEFVSSIFDGPTTEGSKGCADQDEWPDSRCNVNKS